MWTNDDVAEVLRVQRGNHDLLRELVSIGNKLLKGEIKMTQSINDLITAVNNATDVVAVKLAANSEILKADAEAVLGIVSKLAGMTNATPDLAKAQDELAAVAARMQTLANTIDGQTNILNQIGASAADPVPASIPTSIQPASATPAQ